MLDIFGVIKSAVEPVTNLIDELHTSDEERGKVKHALLTLQSGLATQFLGFQQKLIEMQAANIQAEANGKSWLQRNWRPITMLTFLFLVVCDSFGLLAFRLSEQAWLLLQIGLGGYVAGRSAEKITMPVIQAIMNKAKS